MSTQRRFAIAFSFPGETRDIIEPIAGELARYFGRGRILYDRYHEAEFARPNLDVYLPSLYRNEADLIVVMLCNDYERKEWPGLEWRAIRDLIKGRQDHVMFLRADHATVSGVYGIDGYISINGRSTEELSQLIKQRYVQHYPGTQQQHSEALPRLTVTGSPRAMIIRHDPTTILWPSVESATWNGTHAALTLLPDDDTDGPVLDRLEGISCTLAYQDRVWQGTVHNVRHSYEHKIHRWSFDFHIERQTFLNYLTDVGYGDPSSPTHRSPEQLAILRARRLLLNETTVSSDRILEHLGGPQRLDSFAPLLKWSTAG